MSDSNSNDSLKTILDDASNLSLNQIRRLLKKMTAPEIAHALESVSYTHLTLPTPPYV